MRLSAAMAAVCLCVFSNSVTLAVDAGDILSQTEFHGGLIVHLDCGDGSLTAQLCRSDNTVVCGLERDPAKVAQARTRLHAEGVYGRVTVVQYDGNRIPLLDDSVTLIVAEKPAVPRDEILRVLHPFGKAWIGGEVIVKPLPSDMDQWTHYLHEADNNAVAHDGRIGPPRHMQFLADPLWTRNHDRLSSFTTAVTAEGRLFYISDYGPVFDPDEPAQWFVTARDAFNGAFLWRRPITSWTDFMRKFRSGPVQLQRLLATDGKRVFVTLGLDEPVSVLNAADGEVLDVYESTRHAEEFVLDDDVLYVQIGTNGAEHALIEQGKGADPFAFQQKRLVAVDTRSGKTLWTWPAEGAAAIMPRTLAVASGNVFVQESNTTLCLDARTGTPRWRTPLPGSTQNAKKGQGNALARSMGWTYATLVVHDDVVLSCDGKTLQALNRDTGELLWQCEARTPFGRTPSVDILVVRDVVWTSPDLDTGRDLHTGEIVRQTNLSETLVTAGHHHRCYRNKATDRYVIQGYRGLEFRDTVGNENVRHNWIRGICQYGILPANGMVYLPPHNCSCYPEAKLYGLWGLKSNDSSFDPESLTFGSLVEKGPAFGRVHGGSPAADEWPMHRHDPSRSGLTPASASAGRQVWRVSLKGRPTAPVIAGNTFLAATSDTHELTALDAETGEKRWSLIADGPIDSPPTIYGDVALFGTRGGTVDCVRLSDGALVWRFRAAPADIRTLCRQQIESLWPVHGSVLIVDDTAYFTAGRSTYIDGGLFLYGLNPLTGEVKFRRRLQLPPAAAIEPPPDATAETFSQNAVDYKTLLAPDRSDAFSMNGNLSDILVADDEAIYLRHQKFSRDLKPLDERTHHLFSTSSLLDEDESYRAHWFYGNGDFSRLPVAYEWLTRGRWGGFASPLGRFLVFDKNTLWGCGWKSLALYKTDIRDIDRRLAKDFPREGTAIVHEPLADELPIHVRAMIKAGDVLYLAGYPLDKARPHLYGQPILDAGKLLVVDATDGKILAEHDLPVSPRFDGMAAAYGRLYIALEDGSIVCRQ
ncbi:hypothetical protein JCM19992_29500 [Thermostilla marina]